MYLCKWSRFTCAFGFLDFPPEVVDSGAGVDANVLKKKIEEAVMVMKSTYWYIVICTHTHSKFYVA